jgi:hypothetical protein
MNRRQISNFLDQIIPGIKFDFRYGSPRMCGDSPAAVDERSIIWLNRRTFRTFSEMEQKGILMHEVGHILIGDFKSPVDCEYFAQIMAIGLAKKNKWKKLCIELQREFHEWAHDFNWNDEQGIFRRYILAGRKFECSTLKHK